MSARKKEKPLILSFESGITNATSNKLLNAVDGSLSQTRVKDVHLLINSTGGYVEPTLRMFHRLRSLPIRLSTYVMGMAQSSAITLFLAGEQRYSYPNSTLFFHEITQTYGGNGSPISLTAEQLRVAAEGLDHCTKRFVEILTARTRLSESDAERLMTRTGVHMSPEQAQKHGVVHEIRELSIPVGYKPIVIRD